MGSARPRARHEAIMKRDATTRRGCGAASLFVLTLVLGCEEAPLPPDEVPRRARRDAGRLEGAPPERCSERGSVALDEDLDGLVDEGCACAVGETQPCFEARIVGDGRPGVGACTLGVQACVVDLEFGTWGECVGSGTYAPDACGNGVDDDCDGVADEEGCLSCASGDVIAEVCGNGLDDDCDGFADETCLSECVDAPDTEECLEVDEACTASIRFTCSLDVCHDQIGRVIVRDSSGALVYQGCPPVGEEIPVPRDVGDLEVSVSYSSADDGSGLCSGNHGCDTAIFDLTLVDSRAGTSDRCGGWFGRADLNNANDAGSRGPFVFRVAQRTLDDACCLTRASTVDAGLDAGRADASIDAPVFDAWSSPDAPEDARSGRETDAPPEHDARPADDAARESDAPPERDAGAEVDPRDAPPESDAGSEDDPRDAPPESDAGAEVDPRDAPPESDAGSEEDAPSA